MLEKHRSHTLVNTAKGVSTCMITREVVPWKQTCRLFLRSEVPGRLGYKVDGVTRPLDLVLGAEELIRCIRQAQKYCQVPLSTASAGYLPSGELGHHHRLHARGSR